MPSDSPTTSPAPTILVVEDDRNLAETLVYNLQREGYQASIARTGLEALAISRTQRIDLMLLDLTLPEMDGFEVCRAVRARSPTPIIIITARDDEVDRVLGLELGADDYVIKPFSLRELLARVRATLRRVELSGGGDENEEVLTYEGLRLEARSRTVERDGESIDLLPREFDLLAYLMRNHGLVLTRDRLIERVWGSDYLGESRTVDVHVRRLRQKIELDAANPHYIHTIYGVGYLFGSDRRGGRHSTVKQSGATIRPDKT